MQKLGAAILIYLGLVLAAPAQQVTNPLPNAGIYGAYNSGAQTCVTGTGCWVQTDINGNLKVTIAGGNGGNGLVQTSPPAYTNGTSQPITLNQQGALPTASLVLPAATCSTLCSTINATLLSQNTWGYSNLSVQLTATDGSLLEIDTSQDSGTTWSQATLEVMNGPGAQPANGSFSQYIPTFGTPTVCARIPNPGGLIRVRFVAWSNGTVTIQPTLSNGNACARPTVLAGGSAVAINDLNGNGNIPPVVGGSAISSLVLKNSAGYFYGAYATCTAACWLMIFNAVAAPSNGATTAGIAASNMQECIFVPAGGSNGINYLPGPPSFFTTGITAVISSTSCGTLTLASTGFIHGVIR